MSTPVEFAALAGTWTGTSRLWVMPGEPVHESESTMTVALLAQGLFISFAYTWAYEGSPHDGFLLAGCEGAPDAARAVWVDSFHMQDKIMPLQGAVAGGVMALKGSFAAPPGPDWGWSIEIEPKSAGSFRFAMFVAPPDEQAALAVECMYARQT